MKKENILKLTVELANDSNTVTLIENYQHAKQEQLLDLAGLLYASLTEARKYQQSQAEKQAKKTEDGKKTVSEAIAENIKLQKANFASVTNYDMLKNTVSYLVTKIIKNANNQNGKDNYNMQSLKKTAQLGYNRLNDETKANILITSRDVRLFQTACTRETKGKLETITVSQALSIFNMIYASRVNNTVLNISAHDSIANINAKTKDIEQPRKKVEAEEAKKA